MQKIYIVCVLLFSMCSFSQKKLDVFFDFNQDVPNEASQIKINQWVLDNKSVEVTKILGYCDSVDDNKYNRDLAMRRVNTIVEFFNKSNIKVSDKVALKSFGEDFKYSKIQSENRKVEVFYNLVKDKNQETKTTGLIQTPFGKVPGKSGETMKANADETVQTIEEQDKEFLESYADMDAVVEKERSELQAKFDKAKKGDLIRISNINFYFNKEVIMEKSMPLLDELFDIMLDNPKMIIEIHGHICCNQNPNDTKLSYRRALVIFKYLQINGIELSRMAFRGYGSNDPIYKLPELNEMQRAANRRVEILIVNK